MNSLPEESIEELYEHAPCGYFSTLPDGTITRVNQTFLQWTGYEREDLLSGRRWMELLSRPGRVFYETHFAPLLHMQGFVREIACDLLCPARAPLPVLINAVQVVGAGGQPLHLRFTVFDATDRRRYERELLAARRRTEHYAAIVQASADAILSLGPQGTIQTWNAAAERLFGFSEAEAVGQSVLDLIPPEEWQTQATAVIGALQAGRAVQMETACVGKDGRRLDVWVSLTPHREPPGELVGISAILRDISAQQRAAAELRARAVELGRLNAELEQRNEELDAFAYVSSHDLKEPLRGIRNYAQFFIEDYGDRLDVDGLEQVQVIQRLAVRMQELIDALLHYARIGRQELQRSEMPLAIAVKEASELLMARLQETGATIRTAQPLPVIRADRVLLVEVLTNLIGNALKYNDKAEKWVEIGAVPQEQELVFYVRDNGIGIAPEQHERVFRIFKRLHQRDAYGGGTGAGLTIVRRVIERHGGRIWLESVLGEGTTFYFTLGENSRSS
ncbi:MAG TPA: PAS domain S-box protein [Blastocatellia bacterium]|nr:PAS domain S-box protein [Blastocatellia bacterium]